MTVNGIKYFMDANSRTNEGFIGFFDWLRDDRDSIKGIRICFFEDQDYNDFLIKLPYVNPTFDNKLMEVLFEGSSYAPELSGDQDFTNVYVYQSDSGDYIFTFPLDFLSEQEMKSLLVYCEEINEDELNG